MDGGAVVLEVITFWDSDSDDDVLLDVELNIPPDKIPVFFLQVD